MDSESDPVSSALEELIARFGSMVRAIGNRHRLSDADVDEVMQEVRIRLWHARGSSEQIATAGASYVYRTAASAALDILRRRRARGGDMVDSLDDKADSLPSNAPQPHGELESAELTGQIASAVDSLELARRTVVRMYLSGYDREEISALLGWSEGKTRNLLYRGLADLRSALTKRGITGV